MHHAGDRHAPVFETDQRAPDRQAGDEGAGAVDRIEHPDVFGIDPLAAEFLAENAVLGMALGQEIAHRPFRRPIAHRHRVEGDALELVLDLHPRAEVRQDRPPGDLGQFVEKRDHLVAGGPFAHDRGILRSGRTVEVGTADAAPRPRTAKRPRDATDPPALQPRAPSRTTITAV